MINDKWRNSDGNVTSLPVDRKNDDPPCSGRSLRKGGKVRPRVLFSPAVVDPRGGRGGHCRIVAFAGGIGTLDKGQKGGAHGTLQIIMR